MLKKIKTIAVGVLVTVAGLAPVTMLAQPVSAAGGTCPTGTIKQGQSVNNLAECNVQDDDSLMPTVQVIINVALAVLGLVAVVMIIMGGFNYMTSSGDTAKVTKARNTILYGVIGLVIALLAFAIVNFVLDTVFNNSAKEKERIEQVQLQNQ